MATDTFLKNPVLIVGTKQEVSAATIQENDLVAVTDERFYTAEEVDDIVSSTEQDIRDDMNASDSELQTQITAHAGEITAIKGDITTINDNLGDLGDQVSAIESKIPNGTTDSNQLVNKQELTDTVVDIKGDVNQADSELQSQITAQAERIAELDSEKLDNNLGAINAGKVLTVDSNGNIIAASTTETGGLVAVAHDTSLKGAGKDSDPLGVADSILEDISTTKNDLGDLGDQVSGIESKIPEDASEQNQLATRNQITELQSSKQDIATAVNYDNITNCITEIPQDIKLEIVDGAVVLKAGSKVYVPNGAGVFDVVDILNDVRYVYSGTEQLILLVSNTGKQLIVSGKGLTVSGATDSLSGTAYHTWYDTTNNVINRYNASASEPAYLCSFPIAVITVSNGVVTSIDQVFNGFGYIGGTIFALPGIKGLVPNGRNADGTLNSINVFNATTVKINTPSDGERDICLSRYSGYTDVPYVGTYIYDAEDNFVKRSSDGLVGGYVLAGKFTKTGGQITDFYVRPAFHAVDYSEYKNTISSTKKELTNSISSVDSSAVHKTGNETIAGIKTFEASPIAPTPASTSNSGQIATTAWSNAKFLQLAGGTMSGVITTKSQIMFENASSTGHRGFLYKVSGGELSMGIQNSNNSGWQSYQSFFTSGQYLITVSDGTNSKQLSAKPDGTLTWDGKQIVRLVAEQKATSANNYTWYRKYSNGLVEQGGIHHRGSAGDTVNLPIAMSNEYYELQLTAVNPTNINRYAYANTYTSTYFKCGTADDQSPNNDGDIRWYVCGYAAE